MLIQNERTLAVLAGRGRTIASGPSSCSFIDPYDFSDGTEHSSGEVIHGKEADNPLYWQENETGVSHPCELQVLHALKHLYFEDRTMSRRIVSRLPAFAMAGLLILGLSLPAHATLQVTVNGTNEGTNDPTNNFVTFSYHSSPFTINGGTATGAATLGFAGIDLSTLTLSSSGSGTITLIISESGLSSPIGQGTLSETLSAHFTAGSGDVSYTTYGDQNNTLYSSSPSSNPPTVVGTTTQTYTNEATNVVFGATTTASFTSTNPYSMTEVLSITFGSAGGTASISSDASSQFTGTATPSRPPLPWSSPACRSWD